MALEVGSLQVVGSCSHAAAVTRMPYIFRRTLWFSLALKWGRGGGKGDASALDVKPAYTQLALVHKRASSVCILLFCVCG